MKKYIQVNKEHYFHDYDNLERFISYYYQCKLLLDLKPKTVLEIGVGNRLTSDYLKNYGLNVTSCDIDKALKPDFITDVRKLNFKNNSFDVVYAFQVLEHLPFEDFEKSLLELYRVSNKYVVISLPFYGTSFEIILKFPLLNKLIGKSYINLFFRFNYFFKKFKFNGQHYWELGSKGCSLNKIRNILNKKFKIIKELRPVLNSYHYFFVLEKLS